MQTPCPHAQAGSVTVQAYFDRLGSALEDAWSRTDRDEERFPKIAHELLQAMPPANHLDRDQLVAELLDRSRPARRQLTRSGEFGQPGYTVFYGHGFLIDVYFWTNSASAIHNHPFCGVFTVLEGHSVHAVYTFDERERLGARVRIGDVRQIELALVQAGEYRLFSASEHPLIHSLIHVPVGAISMVVRTERTVGYYRYLPPSIAVAAEPMDDDESRRLELLETLWQARDASFKRHLMNFLREADFESSLKMVSTMWAHCDRTERSHVLSAVRERQGPRADLLPAVIDRELRFRVGDLVRHRVRTPDDRLIAAVLMLAETRQAAMALLSRSLVDPVERLHCFADEIALADVGDPAIAAVAHARIDGIDDGPGPQSVEARHNLAIFDALTVAADSSARPAAG